MQSALGWAGVLAKLGTGWRLEASRCALAAVPVTSTTHRTAGPPNARLHAVLTNKTEGIAAWAARQLDGS